MKRRVLSTVLFAVSTTVAAVLINLITARFEIIAGWMPVVALLVFAVIVAAVAFVQSQLSEPAGPVNSDLGAQKIHRHPGVFASVAVGLAIAALILFVRPVGSHGGRADAVTKGDSSKNASSRPESATAESAPTESNAPADSTCPLDRAPSQSAARSKPTTLADLKPRWQAYADPKRFCVAKPASWTLRQGDDGIHTFFDDPTGARTLEISQSTHPADNPLIDFENKVKKSQYPHELQRCTAYEQIHLDSTPGGYLVTVRSGSFVLATSADWEFACTLDGRRRHAYYRNFITTPHVLAYAIVWYTNDSAAAADQTDF